MYAMEANVSKYTNAIGSGKQAITQRQKRKGGRGMREGWEYKKLGEVGIYPNKRMSLTNISGQQYVGVETLVKDRGGVAFSEELPNVDTAIEFLENDILIGNIRPYLKKIWKADRHGASSGDAVNIRIAENFKGRLDSSFLYKVLSSDSLFEYDNSNTHGAKMPRGDRKAIAEFKIPIPPLSTQQSIVSELDKINELIRLKKEQLKDYDNLAQSIFYEMFGDPVVNEKGWDNSTIESVCSSIVRGPFGSALKKEFFVEPTNDTYKVYEQKHAIQKNHIIGSYYITKEKFQELRRFEVFPGDIIMSCSGTIGEFYQIPKEAEKGVMNQALLKFTLNENRTTTEFFMFLMNFIKNSFETKGTGLQNIGSVKVIKSTILGLPPLPLQQTFAQRIELIEKQKAEVQRTIADLETLLASRMQYWFD